MYKILAGLAIVCGVGMIAIVTPYPKEVFCSITGFFLIIGGFVGLLSPET